ncbi:28S ribosomal protein S27 like protein [Argiope bruennichi]|uniref:28S ribosomal protein S27 like protein n=1 Tax=Argiope bruennichi TaxID=94029 RepID=A0A8T0FXU1_ARGBR|nr:28S ribosomal protein S27 like protein [Argiope bruennichi]
MLSLRNLRHGITSKFPLMQITAVRGVLSEAYLCEEAWQKRLQSPLLKDLKMDLYFVEVDKKFGTKHLVSGVEIDLFANNVQDGSNLDELEHLLYRFRRTKRATEMMDSTNYAVIRAFIKFKQYDSLMRILTNREGYGVFPDLYSYNIIMSTFLNEKMYAEAARTAILMMKLKKTATEKQDDDEEEVQLVRVPFLRNYWFDDHFDITNPKHLIGKTFYLIGREMDHILGRSYQIIGLAMYEKWNKAAALLMTFSQSKDSTILNESVERTKAWIEEIADDDENTREKLLNKFDDIFKKMESKSLIQNGNLNTLLESYLKETLLSEKDDIEAQQKLFSVWENERKEALDRQNAELDKERRLKMIEEKKDYLFWKEKLLFFFENEDKNLEELKKVEELMEALKVHKKVQDTYEPPEIVKKAPERVSKYQRLVRVKKI